MLNRAVFLTARERVRDLTHSRKHCCDIFLRNGFQGADVGNRLAHASRFCSWRLGNLLLRGGQTRAAYLRVEVENMLGRSGAPDFRCCQTGTGSAANLKRAKDAELVQGLVLNKASAKLEPEAEPTTFGKRAAQTKKLRQWHQPQQV